MFWLAIYNDGTFLPQFNEDGYENKYADIDRTKLKEFCILDETTPVMVNDKLSAKLILSIIFERPTQKLIYRQRTWINANNQILGRVWLVGWHENVNGKSIKAICYVYPDGHIELAGSKDDVELITCEL